MEWLKTRIGEAISGAQPINRRLLTVVVVLVATVGLLIANLNSPVASAITVASPSSEQDSIVVPPEIYVHVVGEVKRPGIYQLEVGARVFDAIFAAGGLSAKAEQASLNLARQVSDGEQLVVFRIGQAQVNSANPIGGQVASAISLNSASLEQLESLPGVGPALAGRMIDWRKANGGFKSKEDLMKVSGIGPKLFAAIKPLVSL